MCSIQHKVEHLISPKNGDSLLYLVPTAVLDCHCAGRPFGEYQSLTAVLGLQCPEVTRQRLVRDWLATPEALMRLTVIAQNTVGDSCKGE